MALHAVSGTDIRVQISEENAEAYNFVVASIEEGTFTLAPGPKPRQWWVWQGQHRVYLKIFNDVWELLTHMVELGGDLEGVLDEHGTPTRRLVKV